MTTTEIRIDGCIKNIEKANKTIESKTKLLQKKLDKCVSLGVKDPAVEKDNRPVGQTSDQYWAICDWSTVNEDLVRLNKKVAELRERLTFWKQKKQAEDKKADVPMIPAVEEFLKRWRASAEMHYRKEVERLNTWKAEYREYRKTQLEELVKLYGEFEVKHAGRKTPELKADMKKRNVDESYMGNYINANFTQDVVRYALFKGKEFDTYLTNDLDTEVIRKRIDLYGRCSAVVGVITDATGLRSSGNGSINGVVVGEDGKAFVETILAGGYNIQCLHYRVLVKPLKDVEESSKPQQKSSELKEKSKPEKMSTYKNKTLQELLETAQELGVTCKEYSDEKIYRMRLVMAIKAKRGE